MFDFFMLVVVLGIGAVGGYLIAQSDGENPVEKAKSFLGLRYPPEK